MTWEYGGQTTWVEVRLNATSNERTHLELEHIVLVPDKMWDEFGPGAVGVGWDMGLMGLARHIETGVANDRHESMAWVGSENGKAFARPPAMTGVALRSPPVLTNTRRRRPPSGRPRRTRERETNRRPPPTRRPDARVRCPR
jgi:hypothetical protein